ncbi:MAG: transcriptional regulator [Chloroflexaceae bacterium]|nr:transcriptional regulator [Chloroflexaceae bacterium]
MEDHTLEALLHDLESDRVERKSSDANRDLIRQAICAFANDLPQHQKPGVLFIGVDDQGNCTNLPITDEMLRKLTDMRDVIQPFPSMMVQKRTLKGCEMVVILVHPAEAPPVRFHGRVWVRVGPRRAIATSDEERRLAEKRRSKDISFDLSPVTTASAHDLDLELFQRTYLPAAVHPDIIEQNDRTIAEQLAALRLVTINEPVFPTVLGALVVGVNPRGLIAGAYVQFLRIDGTELTDPIKDQKEISGPLPKLLQTLDDLLQVHISVASDITSGFTEQRSADYPLVALQQFVRNAILHRNYQTSNAPVRITWFQDRVEILSPGGPFGQVTRQNFGQPGVTDYRNPYLAEAMKQLGFVQRFGVGIALARKQLNQNGNPPPEFIVEDEYILVIVRSKV